MNSDLLSFGSSLLEVDSVSQSVIRPAIPIPARIASQILRAPDSLALADGALSVTFAELGARAEAISVALRQAGLRANSPVGVYLESSADFIAAALGVWKAGGAYLPIDPAYPAERAAYILADSGAPALITRRALAPSVAGEAWTTLCIEDLAAATTESADFTPTTTDDLAYVIYTSGSTGQPKGVEITHGNLANLVDWHIEAFSVSEIDRATQVAGPGFDAAVWEIWPYLAVGASIHIPSREARLSAANLRDWLLAEKITISFVPTVLAEEMLHLAWPSSATDLRYLLTGGDALHSFPPAGLPFQLVNNYGPTECTVVATSSPVARGYAQTAAPAIGHAILNTSIYLLDEAGREVAEGEPGELYITGASVGRGYRNRPDLTEERFVTITVAGKPERAFRTGDLAKQLPDGQFAFVGRADDQIKIRGFRIEPDEIASVINRHSAVTSSAVIARSDSGEKRLVAYIVTAPGAELWDHDLRDLLARQLPDYMVPASFVVLQHIPVTPNGKLDKAALPAPTEQNQLRRDNYVAPRNEVEEIVEGILGPILGLERVSIHDNFFLLGGHSLMGAQVIAKVRDIFDVELILRNVFECPTVAKLAAKIEGALTARLDAMSDEEIDQALRQQSPASALISSSSLKVV
jgi:amino acid adenylation domain-containing protein